MPPSVAVVLILTFIESRYPIRFFNSNIAPIILHEALAFLFYFSLSLTYIPVLIVLLIRRSSILLGTLKIEQVLSSSRYRSLRWVINILGFNAEIERDIVSRFIFLSSAFFFLFVFLLRRSNRMTFDSHSYKYDVRSGTGRIVNFP